MAALVLLTLPFTLHIWKGFWDYYWDYSGVVVDKDTEFHLLGRPHFSEYLILKDWHGNIFKKYVGNYGYAFAHVGNFVVKKRGFGNYSLSPGEKTPGELLRKMEGIKRNRANKNPDVK